jgi:hypothetical protein
MKAEEIKKGDMLAPLEKWNKREKNDKLSTPTEILGVRKEWGCQTGTMVKVRFENGGEAWLDAAWFGAE